MNENFLKLIELFKAQTEKKCYKIDVLEEEPSIIDDKIGGKPYLPVGEEYPKDKNGNVLALLLQVNLSQVDLEGYPKKGILEIFTDKDVDYPCQYAVRYFEENLEYQTDLPEVDLENYIVKRGYKIALSEDICYMPIGDYRFTDIVCAIIKEVYNEDVDPLELDEFFNNIDWYEKFVEACNNPQITIGGYADFTQDDPRHYLKENRDECLFKLDSCTDYDKFEIGDSGILFTLISQEDIENSNFRNALVDWDCC